MMSSQRLIILALVTSIIPINVEAEPASSLKDRLVTIGQIFGSITQVQKRLDTTTKQIEEHLTDARSSIFSSARALADDPKNEQLGSWISEQSLRITLLVVSARAGTLEQNAVTQIGDEIKLVLEKNGETLSKTEGVQNKLRASLGQLEIAKSLLAERAQQIVEQERLLTGDVNTQRILNAATSSQLKKPPADGEAAADRKPLPATETNSTEKVGEWVLAKSDRGLKATLPVGKDSLNQLEITCAGNDSLSIRALDRGGKSAKQFMVPGGDTEEDQVFKLDGSGALVPGDAQRFVNYVSKTESETNKAIKSGKLKADDTIGLIVMTPTEGFVQIPYSGMTAVREKVRASCAEPKQYPSFDEAAKGAPLRIPFRGSNEDRLDFLKSWIGTASIVQCAETGARQSAANCVIKDPASANYFGAIFVRGENKLIVEVLAKNSAKTGKPYLSTMVSRLYRLNLGVDSIVACGKQNFTTFKASGMTINCMIAESAEETKMTYIFTP